ncbi:MAG: TolC family protein [Candidatus Omnitrophica bacterium]|nr:TolC family protein [Candidatus Omnitrophota bacterium]
MILKKTVFLILTLCTIAFYCCSSCAEISAGVDSKSGELLTIQQGIVLVLKDSRLVKIEMADENMSFDDTIVALSPLLPHLSANIAKTYNMYTPTMIFGGMEVPMGDKNPLSGGFSIYQTLFDFGKSISNYKASTEMLHARKASVESVKRTVMLEFIVSYFDLLEAEKMIVVAEREVESLTSYLNDMEHLYEQGVIVENDLLPAKVKLADAEQKLIASNNRREIVAAALNTMLTMPLTESIITQDVKMGILELPELSDAWSSAEAKRPEMVFFNKQIESSTLREQAKTVQNLPTVFVDGGYKYTQNQYMVHEDDTYVNLGAKMDLYDGGATGAEIMKERHLHERLQEQEKKVIEDIRYEVKRSFLGVKDAMEKLEVAKGALAQAEENVRFYRVKYNNGVATSTDVIEAINLQTKAETNYYSADYELKRCYAKLIYSMGDDLISIYNNPLDAS